MLGLMATSSKRTYATHCTSQDRCCQSPVPRSVGAQYAIREEQRNSSRRNEKAEPKQKQCSVVDASGGESKVRCYEIISRRNLEC